MDRLTEIRKIKDIAKQVDYFTLTNLLDSCCPTIPLCIKDFKNNKFEFCQYSYGGSNLLYRARILDERTKELYKLVQDLSFVPNDRKHKIEEYGRVNKPGESMFYASTQIQTACVETFSKGENLEKLMGKDGVMLAVGVWKIEKPITFVRMTSPEMYFERFIDRIKMKDLELTTTTIESIREQNKYIRELIRDDEEFKILEFFSEEFAKIEITDHNEYKITNYFADRVFNRNPRFKIKEEIDGIWYPSVPSCYQETNIVLPPEKVEEKLKFLWADIIWVVHFKETRKTQFIPIEQYAESNKHGEIKWRTKQI